MPSEGNVTEVPCKITSVNYSEREEDIKDWQCKCFRFTPPSGVVAYLASLKGPGFETWKGPFPGLEKSEILLRDSDGSMFRLSWKCEVE